MKTFLAFVLSAALLSAQEPIRGFPQDQWAAEHDLEQKAIALPKADRQKVYLERMAKVPHHAGSAGFGSSSRIRARIIQGIRPGCAH